MATPEQFLRDLYDDEPPQVDRTALTTLQLFPPLRPEEGGPLFEQLPARHRRLLTLSNGLELLAGSYRLFGIGSHAPRDMIWWNAPETWRYTWGERAAGYLFFGESALGNQYAYRRADLGAPDAPVHELYAVTLEPVVSYTGFDAFFIDGFLNGVADDAYHARIASARRQMGTISFDQLLAYVPSPLLNHGEVEGLGLAPMPAVAAMTINGDLYSQLAWRSHVDDLTALEPYEDERGRTRLRARFG
jgi:hypothetical protein